MPEWFGFTTPEDLLDKLARDLARMRRGPGNGDAAFNFFITAWSLVDWIHPNDSAARERLRTGHPILQACAHLADGSKHLELQNPKHTTVRNAPRGGDWGAVPLSVALDPPVDGMMLYVHLDGPAAVRFGVYPAAISLAEATFKWLEDYLASR